MPHCSNIIARAPVKIAMLRNILAALLGIALLGTVSTAAEPSPRLAEPWDSAYGGSDATGQHVVALWTFDDAAGTSDASGHQHELKIDGAHLSPGGRFGQCLESFVGFPASDKRHAAIAKPDPRLSPKGPFTLELWIKPKPEFTDYGDSFLLDKKYVAHDDYQLILGGGGRDHSKLRILHANLGFGADSSTWYAKPFAFEPGVWHHIAFVYDGAGTGTFFIDGISWGSTTIPGRKQISAGHHPLSIGDRIGSNYHGFPGFIDQVRISSESLLFSKVQFSRESNRACFVRMEQAATITFSLTNLQRVPIDSAQVWITGDSRPVQKKIVSNLASGKSALIEYALPTDLRPDVYPLVAHCQIDKPVPLATEESFEVRIVPRRTPRMPVLMWGIPGSVIEQLPRLKQVGFTHALNLGADYQRIWDAQQATSPEDAPHLVENFKLLDDALANDIDVVASLSPAAWLRDKPEWARIDRKGKPLLGKSADVCGLNPRIQAFCQQVGQSIGQAYGGFPAFAGSLIHTEARDAARPCFHKLDADDYGYDIPPQIAGRSGVNYTRLKDFPTSHVIPDDDPVYSYYKWYWTRGDGWNLLNTAVDQGLKKSIHRSDFWTFHDPAARVASVYGSGGSVDYISQWTYCYPDPIRIGLATDELLAMAAGASQKQQVMKMTQIIWYRGQTAPMLKAGSDAPSFQAPWELEQPDAAFITVAPMLLREAFWTKIARPIKGIMYHGWQSLFPCEPPAGYRHTNPQSREELARLVREVIRPLGPTLLEVPPVKSDVAFLESFASEMFAGRGTYGWGGKWLGDGWQVCAWAGLQPEIVFDQTIVQHGLAGYKVLVMLDCDVITQTMAQRIAEFQKASGIIIGDDHTAPAIKPDIVLSPYARKGRADEDKAALLKLADELRGKLSGRYARHIDSSNPQVLLYRRAIGSADYVFAVNDHRAYGQYVGQHGLVMEDGLPSQAIVSIARNEGVVYDLVQGQPVPAEKHAGGLSVPLELGPCDGRMLLVLPRPIGAVQLSVPQSAKQGQSVPVQIMVNDDTGKPVDASVPIKVEIRDPEGRLCEFSGYYTTHAGGLELKLDIAPNDTPGTWQVQVRELAARHQASAYFHVPHPEPWPPPRRAIPKELANPVQPKG